MITQNQVIENFKNGKVGHASHFFAKENCIYSFGCHFTLVERFPGKNNKMKDHKGKEWFLLNGDRYSITTSQHQALIRRHFQDYPNVSFSALHAARVYDPFLIDFWKDDYIFKQRGDEGFETLKPKAGYLYHEDRLMNDEVIDKSLHRIGSVLLSQDDHYFLCSMDGAHYFISQLPYPVESIQEAFESLKPGLIVWAESKKIQGILRQGEWFFIPRPEIKIKENEWRKRNQSIDFDYMALPIDRGSVSNLHLVTRLLLQKDRIYCLGTVRHRTQSNGAGQHPILKLGDLKTVYEAAQNTAIASWSSSGQVD